MISSNPKFPNADEMAQQFLEDIQFGAVNAGVAVPPTGPGTHFGSTATGAGNIASILIANEQLYDNDINPLTATGDALEQIRISDGLPEKPPVQARLELQINVQGKVTIPAGLKWQGPGGVRGTVDSPNKGDNYSGNSGTVTVHTTVSDAGSSGNLAVGTYVNFINPPLNVQTQAIVSAILSLGSDVESDEDKLNRIMLARQNPPAGGNWSQVYEVALASDTNADGAWIYCALGLAGATKVILTRTNRSTPQDRTVDVAGIDAVINAFATAFPAQTQNLVVNTVINQGVNVWYQTSLAQTGGAFWGDGTSAWPEYPMALAHITGATYTADAQTPGNSTALTVGASRQVAAWDTVSNTFIQATLTMVSGTYPGPYTMTLSGTAVSLDGMVICPWAPNLNAYASSLIDQMQTMGPGEYLASNAPRFSRACRRPEPNVSGPSVLNTVQSAAMQSAFASEILQLELKPAQYVAPALPSNNADKPRILVPQTIAFFPGLP